MANLAGGRTPASSNQKILKPFDFGAAHARAHPWVMNPSVDWACSFLLDPMRILHHALSKLDMRR
jgi:hypothetical protein